MDTAIGFIKEATGEKLLTIGGLALGAVGTGLGVANAIRNRKDSADMATMRTMRASADDMLAASVYQSQGGRIDTSAAAKLRDRYVKSRSEFETRFPKG